MPLILAHSPEIAAGILIFFLMPMAVIFSFVLPPQLLPLPQRRQEGLPPSPVAPTWHHGLAIIVALALNVLGFACYYLSACIFAAAFAQKALPKPLLLILIVLSFILLESGAFMQHRRRQRAAASTRS